MKILVFFLVSILFSLGVKGYVSYRSVRQEYIHRIFTQADISYNKLRIAVENPLWLYDVEAIRRVLDEEMRTENILYISLLDSTVHDEGRILYEKVRNRNGIVADFDRELHGGYLSSRKLFDFTGDLFRLNNKIGVLTVIISTDELNELLKKSYMSSVTDSLLMTLFLLSLLMLGLKLIILNPLQHLNNAVRFFAQKDFSSRSPVKTHDEIGYLSRTFNYMAESLEDHNQRLIKQIYFDQLTGLPNRTRILEDLKSVRDGLLLLINIDSFQEVNDFYGYEVGDEILLEVSRRLRQVRSDMFVSIYRIQSDEFAVIIMEHVETGGAFDEVRGIVSSFVFSNINDKIFICNESEISIRATVGVAVIRNSENARALYNADMALKKAKQLQKHYLVYEDTLEIAKEYENNIRWTYILKDAISDDRIVPFYQPIVNNATGLVEKYECLCRLINKNNDIISPYYFLDIAKKTRLYPYITRRIVTKAFDKFENLPYEFSINLSVVDILNDETRRFIKSVIANNPQTAKRAVFEILESEGFNNFTVIKGFIDDIKSYGSLIAVDDFGSGYSNFDHVISLDVDYIKIDASMIKNIDKDRESQIITKTIVNFSKELNIRTVSEYVHSLPVFEKVKELGVDFSQGYFFGEPLSDVIKD